MKTHSKNILITFGRSYLALELARLLHSSGHRVFAVDSMNFPLTRFSNAIEKNFAVPTPRFDPDNYAKKIIEIAHQNHIDLIIPIYEETVHLVKIKHLLPPFCRLFSSDFKLYDICYNKWLFQQKLKELGFDILQVSLIRSPQDLDKLDFDAPFALKPCYSRASQKVRKVYPNQKIVDLEIDRHNPFIAQMWMEGERYCTYSVCNNGEVNAHSVYPVRFAIDGNSCITFNSIHHKGILDWTMEFVQKTHYTGQIAFDFIESPDKKLFAIECNPRATSGVLLFHPDDHLDRAFFNLNKALITPQSGRSKQIATGMAMYGWKKSSLPNNTFSHFLKHFCTTQDVVFRMTDLKPFIFEPLTLANIIFASKKYKTSIPNAFIHDHEWNGEPL